MASTVITAAQLTQVATAQKSYIDNKDAAIKADMAAQKTELEGAVSDLGDEIQGKLDALPKEATAAEIKTVTDMFATA